MVQGMKYGIAAAGALLILTMLSWSQPQPKKQPELAEASRTMEGSFGNEAKPMTEAQAPVFPLSTAAPTAIPKLVAESTAIAAPASITPISLAPNSDEAETREENAPSSSVGSSPKAPTAPKAVTSPSSETAPGSSKPETSKPASPNRSEWIKHQVRQGESLYAIASKYLGDGKRWPEVLAANPRIRSASRVRRGLTLLIPATKAGPVNAKAVKTKPASPKSNPTRVPAATPAAEACEKPIGCPTTEAAARRNYYVVKKGDTLSKIAASTLGTRKAWPKIFAANRSELDSPNDIRAGQRLRIPRG